MQSIGSVVYRTCVNKDVCNRYNLFLTDILNISYVTINRSSSLYNAIVYVCMHPNWCGWKFIMPYMKLFALKPDQHAPCFLFQKGPILYTSVITLLLDYAVWLVYILLGKTTTLPTYLLKKNFYDFYAPIFDEKRLKSKAILAFLTKSLCFSLIF